MKILPLNTSSKQKQYFQCGRQNKEKSFIAKTLLQSVSCLSIMVHKDREGSFTSFNPLNTFETSTA